MSKIYINGRKPLSGELHIKGAKNSVLPLLCASLLTSGQTVFTNVPDISDVNNTLSILNLLNVTHSFKNGKITLDKSRLSNGFIPSELTDKLRSSVFILGSLLSLFGYAKISYPGGCVIGKRPIDIHINAFNALGVKVLQKDDHLECYGKNKGGAVFLPFPSVGATENIIMFSVLGKEEVVIYNAAKEPEVTELATYLKECGANITGEGTGIIKIKGVDKLTAYPYKVKPDRIVSATYASIALTCGQNVILRGINEKETELTFDKLLEKPCKLILKNGKINLNTEKPLYKDFLITQPYPGFATDCQSLALTLLSLSTKKTVVVENVFENRFALAKQLNKMGAQITVFGQSAVVNGVGGLKGNEVCAKDLRSGAALLVAGLAAEGVTVIDDADVIFRGYEDPVGALKSIGAEIMSDGG